MTSAAMDAEDQPTPNLDRLAAEGMPALHFRLRGAAGVLAPDARGLDDGKTPARLHITTFLPGRADASSQRLLQLSNRRAAPAPGGDDRGVAEDGGLHHGLSREVAPGGAGLALRAGLRLGVSRQAGDETLGIRRREG